MHFQKTILALFLSMFLIVSPAVSVAQCAMCKAVAGSNMEEEASQQRGAGLNKGILYLLGIPYAMGMVACVVWYKNRKTLGRSNDAS